MTLFLMKLIGAPLFLAAATLAARRWGETIGGLIIALPLVSGPISVFLAAENGAQFAVNAGLGSLAGTAALAYFGFTYASFCPKGRLLAVALGLFVFASVSFILDALRLSLPWLFLVTIFSIVLMSRLTPVRKEKAQKRQPMKHDLLMRMGFMAVMTIAVTVAAPFIGPSVSGIVSSLPLMALTMALFAQPKGRSPSEAQKVMKGLVSGLMSTAVFYVVLFFVLHDGALAAGYSIASAAAILMQGLCLLYLKKCRPLHD